MTNDAAQRDVEAALRAIENEDVSPSEKVGMLVDVAMDIQTKPKNPDQILSAVALYDKALELSDADDFLVAARIKARKGTALRAIQDISGESLKAARVCFEEASPVIEQQGSEEELAELHMNLGLVLQSLSSANQAKITDAIAMYQKAVRVFNGEDHPVEFAIIHNNLATAFLSMPIADNTDKMREALAVQSFESALKVINLIDNPSEYAMLQNNLGNALQYSSTKHIYENNLRALEAYDEALKVRNPSKTPIEYANTLSNKANCLLNLSNLDNKTYQVADVKKLYQEAKAIFIKYNEVNKCQIIDGMLDDLEKKNH